MAVTEQKQLSAGQHVLLKGGKTTDKMEAILKNKCGSAIV
jgi:hypothetical protein